MSDSETKNCQNCKTDFEITPDDEAFYRKIDVPPPTFCPECRQQRRMAWRNERYLHKRKSDMSGEALISQYDSEARFPVHGVKEFYSRNWSAPFLEYNPQKSFFDQFFELQTKTPQCALLTDLQSLENGSVYQNASSRNKNCYMVSAAGDNEDCLYSNNLDYAKNSMDCLWSRRVQNSYGCIGVNDCNKTFFSEECKLCNECWFLYNCQNCIDCFGGVGLKNKSYCFWGKQLSKKEYENNIGDIIKNLTNNDISCFNEELSEIKRIFPRKYASIDAKSSSSCVGDYITASENVYQGFIVQNSRNVRYSTKIISGNECLDVTDWGDPAELCYESITVGKGAYKVLFSNNCWPECREIQYCDSCSNSHDLFGCIGLKNASFCIFNKQYKESEYLSLKSRIVENMKKSGEYGEFFPSKLSPFPYNETIAYEHFPLNGKTAVHMGYSWSRLEHKSYEITLSVEKIPTLICDTNDSILNEVIECAHKGECVHGCSTAFKIIPAELQFYRQFNIPIPHLCFNCRHLERFAQRNPLKLWHRKCMCNGMTGDKARQQSTGDRQQETTINRIQQNAYKNTATHAHGDKPCPNEFQTSYDPSRPEIVYCEQCYQSEIA